MAKSTNSEIAVLQEKMTNMTEQLNRIEGVLGDLTRKVDAQALAQTEIGALRKDMSALELSFKSELRELKTRSKVQNILSGVLGATLALLVGYFLQNIGG